MDPRRFLDLALVLKSGPPNPENYRTAIGRAYYAAFHVGLETLRAIGVQTSENPGAHGEVMNCLGASGDPDLSKTSSRLRTLHARRRQADYSIANAQPESRKEADTAYLEARQIIADLDILKSDPAKYTARSQIKHAARYTFGLPVN
jgi:uncharacterized protein (UPF0332 family)